MKHLSPKLKNRMKNAALVVLTVLLVALTGLGWVGDLNLDTIPAGSWLGRLYISLSYGQGGGFELRSGEIPAAQPAEFAVQTDAGMKGAQYSESAVGAFLSVFEGPIGAALSLTGELRPADEAALAGALVQPGVFVRYDAALPLSLVAGWMGGTYTAPDDPTVCALFFGADGTLWVRAADGAVYRADLHSAPDPALADEISGQACAFAAAVPGAQGMRPETLLFDGTLTLPAVLGRAPALDLESTGSLSVLLEAFGYDAYVSNYTDKTTGQRVFVNSQSTLRVGEDGELSFRAGTAQGGLEAYLESEIGENGPLTYQVDYARSLLESVFQSFSADAAFAFDSCTQVGDGHTARLVFRYLVGSVPVEGEEGVLAVIDYADNVLVSAELHLRTFVQSGVSHTLLPTRTAAAAAAGGEPYGLAAGYFAEGTSLVPRRYYLTD